MTTVIPPAIIYVNEDISDQVKSVVVKQLFITETISGEEFDNRISSDPNYPTIIKLNNQRILVVRSLFQPPNYYLADIVIFIKLGLASILSNNIGPHGYTIPVAKMFLNKLIHETKC